MSKLVKKMMNDDLRQSLAGVSDVLVVSVNGLDGIQSNAMRLALRQKNVRVQVVKNSLAKRILDDLGLASATQFLDGPSAVAWGSPSIVELAKDITEWAGKLKKLKIKGGATSGRSLTPEQVTALSKLPAREELLGRIVMLALSPAARVAGLINAPAGRIAGQLKTMAEASPEASAEATAPAEPAPAT